MTHSDLSKTGRLIVKLSQMAQAFPDYEPKDIQSLDKLLITGDITEDLAQKHFLEKIDTEDQRYLVKCGEICLQNSYSALAEALIKFSLSQNVISGEIIERNELAKTIIAIVTKFELSQFFDIERQSQRIRFFSGNNYFAIHFSRIEANNRIQLLKLLYETYVQTILESPAIEEIIC